MIVRVRGQETTASQFVRDFDLTEVEFKFVQLVMEGLSEQEIADRMVARGLVNTMVWRTVHRWKNGESGHPNIPVAIAALSETSTVEEKCEYERKSLQTKERLREWIDDHNVVIKACEAMFTILEDGSEKGKIQAARFFYDVAGMGADVVTQSASQTTTKGVLSASVAQKVLEEFNPILKKMRRTESAEGS